MNNADATISADTTTAAASGSDSDTLRRNGSGNRRLRRILLEPVAHMDQIVADKIVFRHAAPSPRLYCVRHIQSGNIPPNSGLCKKFTRFELQKTQNSSMLPAGKEG